MIDRSPHASLGFMLSDVARLMRRRFDQKARGLGLTRAQWQALAHLARQEGINQSGLAESLEIEPITLCRLIDRMEAAGWVERRPDPGDRRARLLFLTDQAQPIFGKMRAIAEDIYAEALAGLAEGTRERMISNFQRMRENLSDRIGESRETERTDK